jgi:hypothetical protein
MKSRASAGFSDNGRRRYPRLDVDGCLPARDVTHNVAMTVEDVSLGGFRALSPVPMTTGSVHAFEIAVEGRAVPLSAQVVYCRPASQVGGAYVIGWRWDDQAATARGIDQVLNYLTNWRSFVPAIAESDAPFIVLDGDALGADGDGIFTFDLGRDDAPSAVH